MKCLICRTMAILIKSRRSVEALLQAHACPTSCLSPAPVTPPAQLALAALQLLRVAFRVTPALINMVAWRSCLETRTPGLLRFSSRQLHEVLPTVGAQPGEG